MKSILRNNPDIRRDFWLAEAPEANYQASELASRAELSLRQLERYFQTDFGCTPREWLAHRRMIAAGELLLMSDSVKEVAFLTGFKQPSHFCREFKRWFGATPSEYCMKQTRESINAVPFRPSSPAGGGKTPPESPC